MRVRTAIGCAAALLSGCGGDEDTHSPASARDAAAEAAPGGSPGSGGSGASGGGGAAGTATGGATATGTEGGVAGAGASHAGGAAAADAGPADAGDGGITPPPLVLTNQVDLLLAIDNSISMADKQELLQSAVPHFVRRLVNPDCVNPTTGERTAPPSDATAACPAPFVRVFSRVTDLHLGIISSSLGSAGTSLCSDDEQQDDHGRLLGGRPRALDLGIATAEDGTPGFLSWDPEYDTTPFIDLAQELVARVGEVGCGYESTLESWYRFLVDPAPPESLQIAACSDAGPEQCVTPVGLDNALLAQRSAFLRPESALVVLMLSDENDCSVRPEGQLYRMAGPYTMPRAATICGTNPNDPCCYSCDSEAPDGCAPDPICTSSPTLSSAEDNRNLRCYNQMQRFGRDYLYPVERYSRALTNPLLCTAHPDLNPEGCPTDLVPNPIFSGAAATRSPELVVLMGIIGVPWQDLQATTSPSGIDYPSEELQFQTAAQMRGDGTWAVVLGDPAASPPVAPTDPLMIESTLPRPSGIHPITGEAVAPPSSGYLANSINGHEWNIVQQDDLQFACIMPLSTPRDCTIIPETQGCDCRNDVDLYQNPVCQGSDGQYSTIQRFAKAYPGTRFLRVLEQLEDRAVVGSICARNVDDDTRQDYGYGPATDALMRRLSKVLK